MRGVVSQELLLTISTEQGRQWRQRHAEWYKSDERRHRGVECAEAEG